MAQNPVSVAHPRANQPAKPLSWPTLIGLFGLTTLLNYFACQVAIPYLDQKQIMPIEIAYFLSVGLLVLAPMFFGAIYLSQRDLGTTFQWRELWMLMRIKRLSRVDLYWASGVFVLLSLASFLIAKVLMPQWGMSSSPFFFQNMPLKSQHFWILYVWPLFFFFNIFGEEFWWRGYILPRQAGLTGKWTWLVQGIF